MEGFRFVALGYALLVFLIAPTWLAADEPMPPAVPVPSVDAATETVREAVPELPLEETAGAVAEEAAETETGSAPDREPKPKPKQEPAKVEKKKRTSGADEPVARSAASASVTIRDFEFAPATVTVNEGDTVTWTNEGPTVHTATAEDGSFDTGILEKGESGSATFTSAGTISYICTPHPYMEGTIVVQAASAGSGEGPGSTGGSDTGSGSADDGSGVAGEDSSSDGSGLPATGAEALSIALLGLATLGLGLLLRRRQT